MQSVIYYRLRTTLHKYVVETVSHVLPSDWDRNPEDRIITESGTAPRGWRYGW